jgi:hypothetical protein
MGICLKLVWPYYTTGAAFSKPGARKRRQLRQALIKNIARHFKNIEVGIDKFKFLC